MTDNAHMTLEKNYTCWIEGDGIYLTNPFPRLAKRLLVSNAATPTLCH